MAQRRPCRHRPVRRRRRTAAVRAGRVGSLFNLWGREPSARRSASRSRRPASASRCFFGFDVIHGFRTDLPDPAGRGRRLRPRALGADRPRRRRGGRRRRPRPDLRADARHRPRSALGPDRRRPRRGPLRRRALRRGQGARLPGRRAPPASPRRAKHFVAYGAAPPAATTPRSTSPSARSPRSTCRRSRPPSTPAPPRVMPAFTDLAGVPMTANARAPDRHAARATGASTASSSATTARSASSSATASPPTAPRPRRWRSTPASTST